MNKKNYSISWRNCCLEMTCISFADDVPDSRWPSTHQLINQLSTFVRSHPSFVVKIIIVSKYTICQAQELVSSHEKISAKFFIVMWGLCQRLVMPYDATFWQCVDCFKDLVILWFYIQLGIEAICSNRSRWRETCVTIRTKQNKTNLQLKKSFY